MKLSFRTKFILWHVLVLLFLLACWFWDYMPEARRFSSRDWRFIMGGGELTETPPSPGRASQLVQFPELERGYHEFGYDDEIAFRERLRRGIVWGTNGPNLSNWNQWSDGETVILKLKNGTLLEVPVRR